MALGDVIARLSVALNLETAAFERNVGKAKREVSGFQSHVSKAGAAVKTAVVGMLGVFAVDRIIEMGRASLEFAANLGEQAAAAGTTTKALQEYRFVATQVNVTQEEMDKGLAKLSITLGQAANGNKTAAAAFERLGVSVRGADGKVKDVGEILPEVAGAFEKLGSAADQSAAAADLFGSRMGSKFLPLLQLGEKGLRDMRDRANEMGLVLDDAMIAKADAAADNIAVLTDLIKMRFTVAVNESAGEINELVTNLIDLITKLGSVRTAFRQLDLTMQQIDIWTEPLGTSSFASRLERSGILQREKDIYNGTADQRGLDAANRSAALQRAAPAFVTPRGGNLLTRPPRSSAPATPQTPQTPQTPWGPLLQRPGITRAVGAVSGLSAFAPGGGASDWIKASQASANVASAAARIEAANKGAFAALRQMADVSGPKLVAVLGQATPQMEALRAAAQGILDRLFPEQAELRQYQEDLATLTAAMKAGQLSTEDYARAVNALRQEFNGFADELRAQQQIITTGIGPTLDDFVAQADASWERFSSNLVDGAKVSRVQVVQTFEDMAQDVLNSLSQLSGAIRGGGFLDILTGVLSFGLSLGKAGVFGSGFAEALNRVPGNANGTSNWRGGLSWVGERGPELVDLPRGARVTPNNELGRMTSVQVIPSPYFEIVVDGRIMRAAPAIAQAGATGGLTQVRRMNSRRLA